MIKLYNARIYRPDGIAYLTVATGYFREWWDMQVWFERTKGPGEILRYNEVEAETIEEVRELVEGHLLDMEAESNIYY